jgi:hypothetical protein
MIPMRYKKLGFRVLCSFWRNFDSIMLQLVSDEMGDLNRFIYRRNNGALFRSNFNSSGISVTN